MQKKFVIIRPGALGDIIVTRSLLGRMRSSLPDARIALAAPGERGRFLFHHGLADCFLDWESRDVAWLFTDSAEKAPPGLSAFFAGAARVWSFTGRRDDSIAALFEKRLRLLAPDAEVIISEAIPPGNAACSIYEWLCRPYLPYAESEALASSAQIRITGRNSHAGRYAVIHPGSGGTTKNWPLENYVGVANFLVNKCPGISGLYVTEGEADRGLGGRLCQAVPGARLMSLPALDVLAALLANAAVYIGNDSGVSHLAGAVENDQGERPESIVIFGPSSSTIWSPPLAHVFEAGERMDGLDPAAVCDLLSRIIAIRFENSGIRFPNLNQA